MTLDERLRQARSELHGKFDTIDPPQLEVTLSKIPQRGPRLRAGWEAIAAALVVVLIIGGTALGIWLFAGGGETDVVNQPATTTLITSPTTSTTVAARQSVVPPSTPSDTADGTHIGDSLLVVGNRPSSFRYPLIDGGIFDFDEQVLTGRPFVILLWWPYPSILNGDPDSVEFRALSDMQAASEKFADQVDFVAVAKNNVFEGPPDVDLINSIKDQFGLTFDFAFPQEDTGPLWATRTPATVALFDQNGRVADGYFGSLDHDLQDLVNSLLLGMSPTTSTATTSTAQWDLAAWLNRGGPAALAIVEDFYEALNAGDASTAKALVDGSSFPNILVFDDLEIAVEGAGARYQYNCSISDSEPHVICSATIADDLYSPAGINRSAGATFSVNDRGLEFVSGSLDGCVYNFTAEEYLLDFQNWIVATRPELTNRIVNAPWQNTLWIPCTPYPFHKADGAREVIALVDEFIAQSDRWPINP